MMVVTQLSDERDVYATTVCHYDTWLVRSGKRMRENSPTRRTIARRLLRLQLTLLGCCDCSYLPLKPLHLLLHLLLQLLRLLLLLLLQLQLLGSGERDAELLYWCKKIRPQSRFGNKRMETHRNVDSSSVTLRVSVLLVMWLSNPSNWVFDGLVSNCALYDYITLRHLLFLYIWTRETESLSEVHNWAEFADSFLRVSFCYDCHGSLCLQKQLMPSFCE